jgi:hypothetical protein
MCKYIKANRKPSTVYTRVSDSGILAHEVFGIYLSNIEGKLKLMVKRLPENYQCRIDVDNCNIILSSDDSESEDSGNESNDD